MTVGCSKRRPAALLSALLGAPLLLIANGSAHAAERQYNLQEPVTTIAQQVYDLHTIMLVVCLVIFIAVFGVMFYSVYAHRKSKGAVPEQWHENTTVEILWTVVPVFILLGMAWPATKTVLAMKDTSNADITIKATGYQWKWSYDYVKGEGEGVRLVSSLKTPREQIDGTNVAARQANPAYLLEVDEPLVVPVGKKIRLLTTANDVIHAWWVPAFSVKQDAIPGFIRDTWFRADKEGIYRGNCAELCGKDHGFMPIEVHVLSAAKYAEWVASRKAAKPAAAPAAEAAPAPAAAPAPTAEAAPAAPAPAEHAKDAVATLPAKVFFDKGKSDLPDDAAAAVKAVADFMAGHPDAKVDITGFTDKSGSLDKNLELAKERAKAVREALKAAGVAADRINMKKPEAVTADGADKEARRVEINPSAG